MNLIRKFLLLASFCLMPAIAFGQTSQIPFQCKDTSGSSTAQVCTTVLTLTPVSGDSIIYTTTTTNTGDVTINVDGTGPAHIIKWSRNSVLAAGDLPALTPVLLIYDGANWEIQTIGNPPTGTGSGNVVVSPSFPSAGNPVVSINTPTGVISTAQSIDCTVYGVVGNGFVDDTVAVQTCANALGSTGGTLKFPANLTILMTGTNGLPITFPHTPVLVQCGGSGGYGQATTFFETNTASLLFQIGTINKGSAQQSGVSFQDCGFQDSSSSHNTALGAILVTDTNNASVERSAFANFNRPKITAPAATSLSSGGSTTYFAFVTCVTDAGGKTSAGTEFTTTTGTATSETVTSPGSGGCPAPSTGWNPWVTNAGGISGGETLQAAVGCTLNTSGTGCALTSNWVGTPAAGNLTAAAVKYDTSAGFGILTDSQSGANGTSQDASYGHLTDSTFQNMQESFINNGGAWTLKGNHFSAAVVYNAISNKYQAAEIFGYGVLQEIANTTTARGFIFNGNAGSFVDSKWEGQTNANTNITCAEVNSSRNRLSGEWTKCGVALIQENAGLGGNTYDIHQQVSNLAPTLITGLSISDIVIGDTLNGGPGSFIPELTVKTSFVYPSSAGFTAGPTSNLGYDSTNKNTHVESNGGDGILAPLASGFVSGHCGQPTQTAGVWVTADAGSNCASGGGSVSGQAAGVIPLGTSASVIGAQSHMDDGNTTAATITSSENVVAPVFKTVPGANPGMITLPGATGTPTIGSNLFGIEGPSTATFTSYVLQMSSTAPSGTQALECGTPSSNISTCSWVTASAAVSSVSNSDGTLTIFPTSGAVVASLNLAQANSWSAAGAASTPGMSITGAPYTGGTATTNFPQFYINDGTGPTTLSTAGTEFGINTPSGFVGNLEDFHVNGGASVGNLSYLGAWTALSYTSNGTTSGFIDLPQGSTSASVAPCNVSTSICIQSPTSVTSYLLDLPGAQPTTNNTFLSCTAANPSVCSWTAGGGVSSIATTSPITGGTITSTGTIACATCVTSAGSLTSTAFMTGAGSQGSQTPSATATLSSGGAPSFPGLGTFSAAGAASSPGLTVTGAPYAAGNATTNFPQTYLNDGIGPTTFSTAGTAFGINAPSGFVGNLEDYHVNGGASVANLTYLGAWTALSYTSAGTTSGFVDFPQGSTSSSTAPCNTSTSICEQAPTSVTSYLVTKPGVSANGVITNNVAAAVDTQGFSGDANHSTGSAGVAIGSGTSIGATTLCSAANCPAGDYLINTYVEITTACGTSGTYTILLTWTDDAGTKSTFTVPIVGTGTAAGVLTTTSTANWGQYVFHLHSTGANAIQYSTTAVGCGTAGPMVGKLFMNVVTVQ